MTAAFWDERFASKEFAYGKEPNSFLKKELPRIKRGRILFPCEGEGRNAVYACTQAWTVYAFDYSSMAKTKAMKLAAEHFVQFEYDISTLDQAEYDFSFDVIALFFTHFVKELQVAYYNKLLNFLKPGGILIGELFSQEQLNYQVNYNSGGPKNLDMLMDIEKMKQLFPKINFSILDMKEVELNEGPYHQGKAHTIQFLGKKNKE